MLYLVPAFVALLSVLIPGLICARDGQGRAVFSIAACLYAIIWGFLMWFGAFGFYGPTPYLGTVTFGFIITAVIAVLLDLGARFVLPTVLAILGIAVFVVVEFSGSDLMNAQAKAQLIGEVKEVQDLAKVMQPADTAHISLVDHDMAFVSAQNALSKIRLDDGAVAGSRYQIGDGIKQWVDGQLWWVFPLEFQGWLKWRNHPVVPGYLRVSAEDPSAEAEAVQTNKKGEKFAIRYLNSACFSSNAERYLRENGYLHTMLVDWTFEADEEWNPYYTVTVVDRTMGYDGLKVRGVVVLNVQTGEHQFYPLGEVPAFSDRLIPLTEVLDYNVKKWGEYAIEGWWYNFWHDDKAQQPTPGWFMTYDASRGVQWFTGFTSMNSADSAMTGFMVSSARTMESVFFRVNGVTEDRAYDTARSLWSNFDDYIPGELVPYNIDGAMTYVVPMKFKDQFKGVSLVSISNVVINGKGNTFQEALYNYRMNRSKATGNRIAPAGGDLALKQVAGVIERVGMPIVRGQDVIFSFMLTGVPKRFQVPESPKTAAAVFMRVGDQIACSYIDTKEPVINCDEIALAGVVFTDENPAQARLVQAEQQVGAEVKRVANQQAVEQLMGSDRAKQVDPAALEQFIKNQQNADQPPATK